MWEAFCAVSDVLERRHWSLFWVVHPYFNRLHVCRL